MASVIKKIARKWHLSQHENILSGRINDIFVNLTFVKHIRENADSKQSGSSKSVDVYLFEALFQPKYEYVTADIYISNKGEASILELSSFLDTNYESFRTSLPTFVNGHFSVTLYQHDAVNVKAWYVIDFLNVLISFLNEHGFLSGCQRCGSNDNLSEVYNTGRVTEICENCRLKQATF